MTFSNRQVAVILWAAVSVLLGAAYSLGKLLRMIQGGHP
jgi:hypothetical protein